MIMMRRRRKRKRTEKTTMTMRRKRMMRMARMRKKKTRGAMTSDSERLWFATRLHRTVLFKTTDHFTFLIIHAE